VQVEYGDVGGSSHGKGPAVQIEDVRGAGGEQIDKAKQRNPVFVKEL
jgi:hypothetical protein